MNLNTLKIFQHRKAHALMIMCTVLFLVWTVMPGIASDNKEMVGWEMGSEYNKLYNPDEIENIKGVVKDIVEIVPIKGMSPGIAIIVNDSDEDILVHVGPASYVKPNSLGVRKGDKIKIRGAWVEIDGKDVFILSKLKKGSDFSYKVRRTSDGKPWWTMSAAEIQKEKSDQQ